MQKTHYNTKSAVATADIDESAVEIEQPASLTQIIEEHKLPGSAANDPRKLALADFLFEHIQQRANAESESI